jgi:hypothetical protein
MTVECSAEIDIDEFSINEVCKLMERFYTYYITDCRKERYDAIIKELQKRTREDRIEEAVAQNIKDNPDLILLSSYGIKLNSLADEIKFADYLKAYK